MTERIPYRDLPLCPTCRHNRWWEYKLVDDAPLAGCGKCGHLFPVLETGWGQYNAVSGTAASDLPAQRRGKETV